MDPASGIGIPVAFGAGLVSFLSPCVLPLVPGYISAVPGVAPTEIRARRVIGPSLMFVGTFSAIFIALGLLGQQALRGALTGPTAMKVSGAVIVAMGVLFLLARFVPGSHPRSDYHSRRRIALGRPRRLPSRRILRGARGTFYLRRPGVRQGA